MASRFYLRSDVEPSPSSSQSAVKPVGTSNIALIVRQLNTAKAAAQTSATLGSLGQTAHQDGLKVLFVSHASQPILVNAIDANDWTFALASSQANNAANSFTTITLYVWRPGSSSVVGYIIDDDTPRGVEWSTGEDGQVFTVAGAAVSGVQSGDLLVFEWWHHSEQAMATSYTQQFYFNGFTDVTDTTTTDAASYIETPQDLFLPEPTLYDLRPRFIPILAQ